MEDYRSKSYKDTRLAQIDENGYINDTTSNVSNKTSSNPTGMQDLRCYSASYASSSPPRYNGRMDIVVAADGGGGDQWKFQKGKSTNEVSTRNWSFGDPELQRKKRVASYKVYTVEGKVKGSFKKSFRWLKERCSQVFYGYR